MASRSPSKTDLVLVHPPAVYDFRLRPNPPSPIADLIPSGTQFEMYPLGFSYLGEYLQRNGHRTRVVNLASRMLASRSFDAPRYLSRMEPSAFGVGFHWLPHAHGAIEVAGLLKELHPGVPVIMGGYSATLFHEDLMTYPQVDFVLRGDSTEEPLLMLMRALEGVGDLGEVPNLTWRSGAEVVTNAMDYVPDTLDHLGDNYAYMVRQAARHLDVRGIGAFREWWSYPLTAVMTCRGCTRDCGFCGGSAHSMRTRFARTRPAWRTPEQVTADVAAVTRFTSAPVFVIGDLRQGGDAYARAVLEGLSRVDPYNCVVLELFAPAPGDFFEQAAAALRRSAFEISPESHDEGLRRRAGKQYSNEALEEAIGGALGAGCEKFDVFFMIGLAGQTRSSVMDTVAYCDYLLERFGPAVDPYIGPLAPFLDPGSPAYDGAGANGYRLLFTRLEDYRTAMLEPHWRDMLSYETESMDRKDIVDATYEAMLALNSVKVKRGRLDPDSGRKVEGFIRSSMELLERVDLAASRGDQQSRVAALSLLEQDSWNLTEESDIVKEGLKWPVHGRRFKPAGILGMLAGRR